MIDIFINDIFDNIDWQTSQSYISETDWTESINQYYKENLIGSVVLGYDNKYWKLQSK